MLTPMVRPFSVIDATYSTILLRLVSSWGVIILIVGPLSIVLCRYWQLRWRRDRRGW